VTTVAESGAKLERAAIKPGRPEAGAAIWDWQARSQASDSEERRRAPLHGALQAAVGGAIGALIYLLWSRTLGAVVWTIAALTLATALSSPLRAYAAIRRAVGLLATAVGVGMGWLLLTPLYFLFFVPFGLLFRSGRRDRLERWFDPHSPTYWKRRRVETLSASDYERQF
jgi:hypothetical protein